MDYQSLGSPCGRTFLRPFCRFEWCFDLAIPWSFDEGFYANQVTFPCGPLIPPELSYGPVICLELELEEVWGDYGLNPVERGPSEDYIVCCRYIDHKKIDFQTSETSLVFELHRKVNGSSRIHLLSSKPQNRIRYGNNLAPWVGKLLKAFPRYDVHGAASVYKNSTHDRICDLHFNHQWIVVGGC